METHVYNDPPAVASAVAAIWREMAESAKDSVHIALAGGSTPKRVYRTVAGQATAIDWRRVHLYWGDERCVPPDHAESNFAMVREALINAIDIPAANLHRIRGENDPHEEAQRYAAEIRAALKTAASETPRFDWVLLGLGEDGHTASLFPGDESQAEPSGVCAVARHPDTGQQRITLTAGVLNRAKRVSFIVTGENKAAIVSEILNADASAYPAANVKPEDGRLEWFLDRAAASRLKASS